GGVARPHLRAHRPPVAIEQHREDHLPQVRPMVLAVAVPAQRLPASVLEVQAGGVHEHPGEAREGRWLPVSVRGFYRLRGPPAASEGWLIDLIACLMLATKDL